MECSTVDRSNAVYEIPTHMMIMNFEMLDFVWGNEENKIRVIYNIFF